MHFGGPSAEVVHLKSGDVKARFYADFAYLKGFSNYIILTENRLVRGKNESVFSFCIDNFAASIYPYSLFRSDPVDADSRLTAF